MQRIIRKINEINSESLSIDHIRTATHLRLPFHLCTGKILRIVDPDGGPLEIWLRNKLSTPHNADIHAPWAAQGLNEISRATPNDFLTDALIINRTPNFRNGEFEAIRQGNASGIGPASLQNPGFRFLNEVIAAHQMVRLGPYVSGMGALWPRMLSQNETFERIIVEVVLISNEDQILDEAIVLRLFDNLDQLPFGQRTSGVGDLRDYSSGQISDLLAAIRKLRNHAFYEIKTNAIAAMLGGDSIVAIVLGCAALEGAHGAFLRLTLRDKVPGDSGDFNKFMNGFLREQGFYSLVQLSTRVLMTIEERPTESDLSRCLEGVTIRNAIMHAGIKGTGKYKIREFTDKELSDGYKGIMGVYRAFEAAVESRGKL